MIHSNLRSPFPSFFFLDRYRFFFDLTFLAESVFSFLTVIVFLLVISWSKAFFLSFFTFLFSFINSPLRISLPFKFKG